jgi:hypothetical protein
MQVKIIEPKTGRLVFTYLAASEDEHNTRSDFEALAEAWRCAVRDGLAKEQDRDRYLFKLVL